MFELNVYFYTLVAITVITGSILLFYVIRSQPHHIKDKRLLGPGPLNLKKEAAKNLKRHKLREKGKRNETYHTSPID